MISPNYETVLVTSGGTTAKPFRPDSLTVLVTFNNLLVQQNFANECETTINLKLMFALTTNIVSSRKISLPPQPNKF